MKRASSITAGIAALVLLTAGVLASARSRVDDPPPEPADCPLCGGDPKLHFARTFAMIDAGAQLFAVTFGY